MGKCHLLAIALLVLFFGCVSTQHNRVIPEKDIPNYLDKISDNHVGNYYERWEQPANKKEKCEVLMWGYKQPLEELRSTEFIWDGACKDGKANGLGKMTVTNGGVDAYEIFYLNMGISDQFYYRGIVGGNDVKYGRYIKSDGEWKKSLEVGASVDSNGTIKNVNGFSEIDGKTGLSKGVGIVKNNDGQQKFTGVLGNKSFFGSVEESHANSQENAVLLGFFNIKTATPDSYVILKNKNGVMHQYWDLGTIRENVQLPQSYIDIALKVRADAAESARLASQAGDLALAMKKKYDSIKSKNQEQSITTEDNIHEISTGTGFFISDNGYLLTNSHVVNGSSKLSVVLEGKQINALLIDQDTYNDIALLKIERSVKGVPLGIKRKIKQGTEISVLGYPNIGIQGNEIKATFGNINSNSGIQGDTRYFQISAPIQPGNSGSPLLNENGIAIGIASASLNQGAAIKTTGTLAQNVNYAVKIAYALPMLIGHNVPYIEQNSNVVLSKTAIVERLSESVTLVIAE